MDDSKQIEQRALAWLAKQDSAQWSDVDQAELTRWLQENTRHRVAFLRLEAGWERSARLKAFGVGRQPGVVPPPGAWRSSPFFERRPVPAVRSAFRASAPKIAALAAGVALVVGAAFYLSVFAGRDDYSTPVGGLASIPLRDGSNVTLNTRSELRVALTQTERRIELKAGEAFFDVAKDPSRPFIVEAGDRRIIAVGTQFSVRHDGNAVQVVVTEGKVRVQDRDGAGDAQILTAGAVLHAMRDSRLVQKKSVHEAKEALSWRSGYLTFDETSLADAIAEFNRYNARQIVIEDQQLAALRINGKFRSTNADEFVQLLHEGFGIQVRKAEETIALLAE
jgi:transmembrane sensor